MLNKEVVLLEKSSMFYPGEMAKGSWAAYYATKNFVECRLFLQNGKPDCSKDGFHAVLHLWPKREKDAYCLSLETFRRGIVPFEKKAAQFWSPVPEGYCRISIYNDEDIHCWRKQILEEWRNLTGSEWSGRKIFAFGQKKSRGKYPMKA